MARSISAIKQTIVDAKNAESALSDLNNPSQAAVYNLWMYITAVAIFIFEGLLDLFKTQMDIQISNSGVWTDKWVQSEAFKFQYDANIPQIVQLIDFVPSYNPLDTTKQIISRASVSTLSNRTVSVKVATLDPPQALDALQLTSFQGYLDIISPAGVQYNTISLPPDELLVGATVYYDGQYSSQIQTNVINSLNAYMANIDFDGQVTLSLIEKAILETAGVNDVVLNNVAIRADSTPFSGTTYLLQNNTEIYNKYPMFSGYVVEETTTNETFADTLTFIVG